jgi:hypothetical protein
MAVKLMASESTSSVVYFRIIISPDIIIRSTNI